MTDHEYHKQLLELTAKLARAASARPYDPDAYNAVLDELTELGKKPIEDRRISPIVLSFVYLSAILFVLYLVYCIVSEGFF